MNYNRVIICGHLGRDPELRVTPSGTTVCTFSMAYTDKREDKEVTSWFDFTAFGRTAETIAQYSKKGSNLLVEGKLKQESWEDKKTGDKRSKVLVIVDNFKFVGGKRAEAPAEPKQEPVTAGGAEDDEPPF